MHCAQAAVHAVTCLEAHQRSVLAGEEWNTLGMADAQQPRDILDLWRMHDAFCSACVAKCLLLHEPQIASAANSLLGSAVSIAQQAHDRLFGSPTAAQQAAGYAWLPPTCAHDAAQRVHKQAAWLQEATGALQQRVQWLKTTLRRRERQPELADWQAAMGCMPMT